MIANKRARLGPVGLEIAVRDRVHEIDQSAVGVCLQQGVPAFAPHHFDDVPSGAAEEGFEFLNDFAVTAHRPIETLQVAVHHKGQVVEALVGGELQHAAAFGLVHFAVPEERPHVLLRGVFEAAHVQIAVCPRLIDSRRGPEPHGHGRKFPQFRHETWMWIGGQPAARPRFLLTERIEVFCPEASLEERASVDARGSVALEIDVVSAARMVFAPEKVVQAHFIQRRHRGIRRDVAADALTFCLGAGNHHSRIPANPRTVTLLDFVVSWVFGFVFYIDGVDVGRIQVCGDGDFTGGGSHSEGFKDVCGPLAPFVFDESIE